MTKEEIQLIIANARDERLASPENPMGLISVAQYLLHWKSQADGFFENPSNENPSETV